MDRAYSDKLQFVTHFRAALIQYGMSPDSASELADALADDCTEMRFPSFPPGTMGLMIPVRHWVVRDEDLKLADAAWSATAAAAAAHAGLPVVLPIVALAAGLWKLVVGAVRKGASVTPLQYRILALLKKSGTASVNEVAEAIVGTIEPPATLADVERELQALTKVTLPDGMVVALVAMNAESRWSACGI